MATHATADFLAGYVAFKTEGGNRDVPGSSDFHLPGTYRGGMVARLQRLLIQQSNGTFVPAPERENLPAAGETKNRTSVAP